MLDFDTVLHFIANSDLRITTNPGKEIYRQFEKRHHMDYLDFVRVLERLFRDGYLNKAVGPGKETTYQLTYEGRQFIKQGGYSQKRHSLEDVTSAVKKEKKIRNVLIGVIVTIVGSIILWFITR